MWITEQYALSFVLCEIIELERPSVVDNDKLLLGSSAECASQRSSVRWPFQTVDSRDKWKSSIWCRHLPGHGDSDRNAFRHQIGRSNHWRTQWGQKAVIDLKWNAFIGPLRSEWVAQRKAVSTYTFTKFDKNIYRGLRTSCVIESCQKITSSATSCQD